MQSKLSGMKISQSGPVVTHLLFADDSLLFCKAENEQIVCIQEILAKYEEASRQEINLAKSSIFFQ